ncbi:MAG: bifunctional DedA family/phosphatase PAP2 family protein [Parvibaculaceae bacterium]
MEHIQPYLDYFSQHPSWAIALVFLIAFGEALLIIGLFVPSTAVLVGAGMLVGTGHLEFWPIFIATTAGAILGDQLSYWAGRLFGQRLKGFWPLNRYPALVRRGEDFVRLHGGKSIAIGRFVPGVKAVIPGVVGMFGMGQIYFASINVISGIFWAACHIFPGMLLGQGLALAGELSGRLVIVLLVLLVLLAIAGWLIRLFIGGLGPWIERGQRRLSAWASQRPGRIWKRFGAVISPEHPGSLSIIVFAALAVTALIAFLHLMSRVFGHGTLADMDLSIYNMMQDLRNAPADEIMTSITMMGDGVVMIAVALVMFVWLLWRRAYQAALSVFVAVLAARIFVPLMKEWLQRPRPVELTGLSEAFSFPSGHTTFATVTLGVLAVLASHGLKSWGKAVVFATAGIAVVAIAYSRIYLGVHWMSDVLGGFLFGAGMIAAFGIAVEAVPPKRIWPWRLTIASLATLGLVSTLHIATNYKANAELYAPREAIVLYDVGQWQDGHWASLSRRRVDLAGRSDEPFLIQWAGGLEPLGRSLIAAGWKATPQWSWADGIAYLDPSRTLADLAPRPALHRGRGAKETWISDVPGDENQRLVVRAWPTDVEIAKDGNTYPLYLVSLTRERLRKNWHLYAVPSPLPAQEGETDAFLALARTVNGTVLIHGKGLEPSDKLLLIDAMKPGPPPAPQAAD